MDRRLPFVVSKQQCGKIAANTVTNFQLVYTSLLCYHFVDKMKKIKEKATL
jgi:hypothetical protein